MRLNVAERMRANPPAKRIYEIAGAFQCDDLARRPNNLRKIDSGVSGTCADIQDAFASGDASPFPTIQHNRTPHVMLHAEPENFFLVRPENVIAIRRHEATVADCSKITTPLLPLELALVIVR
jgi:hypothetical protein